ncbi:hypothetical protein JCM21900_005219, partial [Sporobolomyces salmonicolor]
LNLPFGSLFFGYDHAAAPPPPGSSAEASERAAQAQRERAANAPFAGVEGAGATLSGRAPRGGASLPPGAQAEAAAASPQPEESKPAVPFSGQGNMLGGKKKVDVIEID